MFLYCSFKKKIEFRNLENVTENRISAPMSIGYDEVHQSLTRNLTDVTKISKLYSRRQYFNEQF